MPNKTDDFGEDEEKAEISRRTAILLAAVVRAYMEDFHVKHLSDEQMAELNPVIRNALATALYAMCRAPDSKNVEAWLRGMERCNVADYWEAPVIDYEAINLNIDDINVDDILKKMTKSSYKL